MKKNLFLHLIMLIMSVTMLTSCLTTKKMIGDIAGPEPVLFLVTFDAEGKVIAYDTVKEHHHYLH